MTFSMVIIPFWTIMISRRLTFRRMTRMSLLVLILISTTTTTTTTLMVTHPRALTMPLMTSLPNRTPLLSIRTTLTQSLIMMMKALDNPMNGSLPRRLNMLPTIVTTIGFKNIRIYPFPMVRTTTTTRRRRLPAAAVGKRQVPKATFQDFSHPEMPFHDISCRRLLVFTFPKILNTWNHMLSTDPTLSWTPLHCPRLRHGWKKPNVWKKSLPRWMRSINNS
mmetsp:Transcript_43794/g.105650  ORF Transcript_43794/g.105650 Transcript_43794/m.105650 type:complete len:221 (+) Transcript_43794:668-1330(+)